MERLVDYDKFIKDYGVLSNHEDDYRLLCAAKITAYTKDEVIAMLTEIQLEIEESENCGKAFHLGLQMASNIIQQKIDSLKEQTNGENN